MDCSQLGFIVVRAETAIAAAQAHRQYIADQREEQRQKLIKAKWRRHFWWWEHVWARFGYDPPGLLTYPLSDDEERTTNWLYYSDLESCNSVIDAAQAALSGDGQLLLSTDAVWAIRLNNYLKKNI